MTLEAICEDIEASAHSKEEDAELERALSIGDWSDRIRGAVMEAVMHARAGNLALERQSWIEMAAIATRRVAAIDWAAENVESVEHVQVEDDGVITT